MRTMMTRFGEVEYDPEKTIEFPLGLIGFEHLQHFIVMPNRKEGPLFWIQSIDDPEIAFVLTDPTQFFLDYGVMPERRELDRLGVDEADDCYVLSVVTVHPDRTITLNLLAPILYSPQSNRAVQIILENSHYSTRESLPSC